MQRNSGGNIMSQKSEKKPDMNRVSYIIDPRNSITPKNDNVTRASVDQG